MEAEVEEPETINKSSVSELKTYASKTVLKSGLNTKLEILQDFDEITEEDISEAEWKNAGEPTRGEEEGTSSLLVEDDEIQLPIKLPPDLTVVKEVIPVSQEPQEPTSQESPVKRGRGRRRKNPLPVDTSIVIEETPPSPYTIPLPTRGRPKKTPTVLSTTKSESDIRSPSTPGRGRPKKTPVVSSKGEPIPLALQDTLPSIISTAAGLEYPCSLCPRVFSSSFGRKIHESACRRRNDAQPEDVETDETLPDLPDPSMDEVVQKKRRGRPPKNQAKTVGTPKIIAIPKAAARPKTLFESTFKCEFCTRIFNTLAGCRRHEVTCRRPNAPAVEDPNGYQPNIPIYNKQHNQNQALDSSDSGGQLIIEAVDVKDPYIFEEGRCHCCGEDIETAHMGGEFECVDCKKLFRLKSSLERHRRVIHNEGETHQCPECDARCPDKGTLARHMYTHTGLKPVSCPVCKQEFSRKYHLIRHNYQTGCDGSKRPTFPCQVCGRVFNRKDNLREHLRAHAGQTKRKKRYTCKECNKEFVGISLLNLHLRTHNPNLHDGDKPFGCEHCPKSFPSNSALQKHRRKHTGERPYECTYCFARFAAKETLNRHLRTHTGVKPHTCQYCGKGFIQASQLRAHIFHHSGEGGFTCDQCGKSFNRRQRLQLHVKYVHEGAEPYRCENCDKTFLRKEDLARHQLLHSGVKEHKCPICEKCFAMKSSLKIHLLTHTKEPPRSCDECGRAFIRQDCLLRHMRTKHRDMLEEIMAEAEKKKLQQQLLAAANQAALEVPSTEPHVLNETSLAESIKELLMLLVDETTLKAFGWPDSSVDKLLEAVIRRCGHQPAGFPDIAYADRLRENTKLLFTVVIDDVAVKTLLNNQTVDEVILHVLRLAKS